MNRIELSSLVRIAGFVYASAVAVLVISKAPLGSPLFFGLAAVMTAGYVTLMRRVWTRPVAGRRVLFSAFAFAVLFRIPLALAPVGSDSDMVRYLWDGRVQLLGYNPYAVVPADPSLARTHTAETTAMPSRHSQTPYPPGAQLFFRLVVAIADSTLAMKLALLACDLLTMAVIWRWLAATNRNPWLTLAYAWHPLVILEVAHSGHIDALGALWIAAAAYWLTRRRTSLATVAFVLAIATKLLPVVLAPLFAGRVRGRDAALGLGLLGALYLAFSYGSEFPAGSVPNVVAHIRFNGPVFRAIAAMSLPEAAAATAVLLGLAAAVYSRRRLDVSDPAAWAWPMAIALACAPVIYPWYLLYLTPFLFVRSTLPISAWTFSVLPVYAVWHFARQGSRWNAPWWIVTLEFGVFLLAIAFFVARSRSAPDAAQLRQVG